MRGLGIRLTSSKLEVCGTVMSRWLFSPKHGYAAAAYIQRPNDGLSSPSRRVSGIKNCRLDFPICQSSSPTFSISDTLLSLKLLVARKAVYTYQSVIARAIVTSLGSWLVLVLGPCR